jgi:hypothetical protein
MACAGITPATFADVFDRSDLEGLLALVRRAESGGRMEAWDT